MIEYIAVYEAEGCRECYGVFSRARQVAELLLPNPSNPGRKAFIFRLSGTPNLTRLTKTHVWNETAGRWEPLPREGQKGNATFQPPNSGAGPRPTPSREYSSPAPVSREGAKQ